MKIKSLLAAFLLYSCTVFSQNASVITDANVYSSSETETEIIPKLGLTFQNKYYFVGERNSHNGDVNFPFSQGAYLLCAIDSNTSDVKIISSILPYYGDLFATSTNLYILIQKKHLYISDGTTTGTYDIRRLMQNTTYSSRLNSGASIQTIYSIKNKIYIHVRISSQLSEIYVCDGSIQGSKLLVAINTSTSQATFTTTEEYFIINEYNAAIKSYHYSSDQAIIGPTVYQSYGQITAISKDKILLSASQSNLFSLYKYDIVNNQFDFLTSGANQFKLLSTINDTLLIQISNSDLSQSSDLIYTNGTSNGTKKILSGYKIQNAIIKNKVILALYKNVDGNSNIRIARYTIDIDTSFQQVHLPSNTNWPDRIALLNNKMFIQANDLSNNPDRSHLFEYINGDSAKLYANNQGGNIIQKLNLGTKYLVKKIKFEFNAPHYYWAIADSTLSTSTEFNYQHNGNNFSLLVNDINDQAFLINETVYLCTDRFGFMSFDINNPNSLRAIGFLDPVQPSLSNLYLSSNYKLYEITSNPIKEITSISKKANASSFPNFLYQNDSLLYFSMFDASNLQSATRYSIYELNTNSDQINKILDKKFFPGGIYINGYYYGQMKDDSTNTMYFAKTDGSLTGTIKIKALNGVFAQDLILKGNKIYFDDYTISAQQHVSLWEYDLNTNSIVNISVGDGQLRFTNKNRKVIINDNLYVLNGFSGPITKISLSNNSSATIPAPFGVDTIKFIFAEENKLFIVGEDRIYSINDGQSNAVLYCSILTSPSQSITNYMKVGNSFYLTTNSNKLYKNDGSNTNVLLYSSTKPINHLITLSGKIYFTGTDNTNGTELWSTTGTPLSTTLVSDINKGFESSEPNNYYVYNDKMYFSAKTHEYGKELFELDPSTNNSRIIYDLNTGSASSNPLILVNKNKKFYINCFTDIGFELWKLELDKINCSIIALEDCYHNNVQFSAKLNNTLDSISSYKWYYGNNLYSEDPSITVAVAANDSLSIRLLIQNKSNLIDSIHYLYIKKERQKLDFTINDSSQCLENNKFIFEIDTTNKTLEILSWDLGDSTFILNTFTFEHSYLGPGNYVIQLILKEKDKLCIDTITKNIRVGQNQEDIIMGEDTVKSNETYTYEIPYEENYQYQWYVDPSYATIVGNMNSNQVQIKFNGSNERTFIRVVSEDSMGCIEDLIDTVYIQKSVGLITNINSSLIVYPIPSSDYIYIDTKEIVQEIRIIDVLGKTIYYSKDSISRIPLFNYNVGYYILEVQLGDKTTRVQIIKSP